MARYRDTRTGHFVSKEIWKRSKKRGGKRYKRSYKHKGRYANVLFDTGYDSRTPGNGFVFTVEIQRKKKETQEHIRDRIIALLRKGYFDEWAEEYDVLDFQWTTFHNFYRQIDVKPAKKRKRATLLHFERM